MVTFLSRADGTGSQGSNGLEHPVLFEPQSHVFKHLVEDWRAWIAESVSLALPNDEAIRSLVLLQEVDEVSIQLERAPRVLAAVLRQVLLSIPNDTRLISYEYWFQALTKDPFADNPIHVTGTRALGLKFRRD